MYLSEIKLWNFRRFGNGTTFSLEMPHLVVKFSTGLNLIIGENDSGKSAIIDAIKLVLKTHSYEWVKVDWDDFYDNTERLRIELRFESLADNEAKNFTEWLSWTGSGSEAKPYLRLIYDVSRIINEMKIIPTDIRAGSDDEGSALDPAAKEYLKATYLKPLRDAESELVAKKGSRLSQILLGHEAFKQKEEPHYLVGLFKIINNDIEKYFEGKDSNNTALQDQNGQMLKALIDSFVQGFYDREKSSLFEASDTRIKEILEKLELSIKDVRNPGLGTLNRLFMAVELLHLHKSNWSGVRLGIIEEIEAHLHPQAQMQIVEALQNVIQQLQEQDKQLQLILTSHSPNIASKVKLANILLCNNGNVYSMAKGETELDPNDYEFLERFLDTTKANLFFAKGIILVEGWSEEILLPALARKLNINLTERGIAIVNIGNTAFLRYSRIFRRSNGIGMKIPVAVITDIDIKPEQNDAEHISKISALNEKYDAQSVKSFISPEWTLEYCLYSSPSLSTSFQAIARKIHSGSNWSDFPAELSDKLSRKAFSKTEVSYELAALLDADTLRETPQISIDETDSYIAYLINAIKYASRI